MFLGQHEIPPAVEIIAHCNPRFAFKGDVACVHRDAQRHLNVPECLLRKGIIDQFGNFKMYDAFLDQPRLRHDPVKTVAHTPVEGRKLGRNPCCA